MKVQWNAVDGFETLVAQLTKGLILTAYAGSPIPDVDVVDMGICNILILVIGLYAKEYKIWYDRAQNQNTFPAIKVYQENQVRIKKFTTKTAG